MFDDDFYDDDETENAYFLTTSERQGKKFTESLMTYLAELNRVHSKVNITQISKNTTD